MKTKFLIVIIILSFVGLTAQQKDGAKLQKADESGFIEVDKAPVLKAQKKPAYPELAKLSGIQGTVYLKLLIDENGNVEKAKVEQGVKDMLDNAALEAAKESKFSPALLNNKPVKVWVILPIAFKLDSVEKKYPEMKEYAIKDKELEQSAGMKADKLPEIIETARPDYPELAKRAGIEGKVFVKILVDVNGIPKKADVLKSENEIFNQPAIDAAMKSKFTAALKEGKPIEFWIVLPFKFALGDNISKFV